MKTVKEQFNSLTEARKVKVLMELADTVSISREAHNYADQQAPDISGAAFLIKSLSQRIIVNQHATSRVTQIPIQVFDNRNEANTWLDTL